MFALLQARRTPDVANKPVLLKAVRKADGGPPEEEKLNQAAPVQRLAVLSAHLNGQSADRKKSRG